MNQYVTAIVIAFLTAIGSQLGNLVIGHVELWMLLPMTGFGIAGAAVFFLVRFLWKLHTTNLKLVQNYATLEGKVDCLVEVINAETKQRDDAVKELGAKLVALVGQVKGDLQKESLTRTEAFKDVKIRIEKLMIEQLMRTKPVTLLSDSGLLDAGTKKAPIPLPTEVKEATGLLGLGLIHAAGKK
jgi:hypothetical protein